MGEVKGIKLGKNLERLINEMEVGESAWTFPDALSFDYSKNAYLYMQYPISENFNSEEGFTLLVERYGSRYGEFNVDVSKVKDYLWERIPKSEILKETSQTMELSRKSSVSKRKKPNYKHLNLYQQLQKAVRDENYELAAKLRDEISEEKKKKDSSKLL